MLDPVQLPILLKAIDFVFDEGHKILAERRERRKQNNAAPPAEAVEPEKTLVPLEPEKVSEIKQDLTSSKIDKLLWNDHEQEIQHLVNVFGKYATNYRLAKEQYAQWGSALVPPIIVHNMTEAENSMVVTLKQLETALSKVYNKNVQIDQ